MTWQDINFNNNEINVKHTLIYMNKEWVLQSPKTKSSKRIIYMNDTLLLELKRWKTKQKENKLYYGELYTDSNFVCTKAKGQGLVSQQEKE